MVDKGLGFFLGSYFQALRLFWGFLGKVGALGPRFRLGPLDYGVPRALGYIKVIVISGLGSKSLRVHEG